MLLKLLGEIDAAACTSEVVSLTDIGPVGRQIEGLGIRVQALNMTRGMPDPTGLLRLRFILRTIAPDVIQTWMYHADLVGGLAGKWAGSIPVVWNVRHSNFDPAADKWMTRATARVCAWFSGSLPERIVSCSRTAAAVHADLGYTASKVVIIPNGFDLHAFRPDPDMRISVRLELGIPEKSPVVGMVARLHPQKDHPTFFRAARSLLTEVPEAHAILCGSGIVAGGPLDLMMESFPQSLRSRVHLLGVRSDIPRLTAAFDLAVSSSAFGEAFSNSLGEALAAGVPCVTTDVGDSAWIVGDAGLIVPPQDADSLAAAMKRFVDMTDGQRDHLRREARRRVEENFDISMVADQYLKLYRELHAARLSGVN